MLTLFKIEIKQMEKSIREHDSVINSISHITRSQLFSFVPVTAIAYYSHLYLPQDLAQGTESINGWICFGMVVGW